MPTESRPGRLQSRPPPAAPRAPEREAHTIQVGETKAAAFIPRSVGPEPAPLLVILHGAGGEPEQVLRMVRERAQAASAIVLAPASQRKTWDVIARGAYGVDARALDAALGWIFERYAIDSRRLAIGGFSDGASYALSVGLMNGDLFTHVLAYSPGFMAPAAHVGRPEVFISHGVHDEVLPIDVCSRRLAPQLKRLQYPVRYVEFPAGHVVPEEILEQSFAWWLNTPRANEHAAP